MAALSRTERRTSLMIFLTASILKVILGRTRGILTHQQDDSIPLRAEVLLQTVVITASYSGTRLSLVYVTPMPLLKIHSVT
jgi:hypothetical protein